MNVLICDDERRDLQMVRLHVEQFGKDQQIDVSIYTLWNPKSSAEIMAMAEKHEMDVAFLDIDMPHISGDAIASALTEKHPSIQIIFFTNRGEMVYDMLKYKPFRFIQKAEPWKIDTALMNLSKQRMTDGHVLIEKAKNEVMDASVEEIMYIEAAKHQIIYHTEDEAIVSKGSMAKIVKELWEYGFIRVHVAYVVNIRYIKQIGKKELILRDETVLPISGSYKEETMILGKKKSMPNWLFVVLALIVPVANVVLQKVFPDSPENNIVYILLTIFFGFVCTNGKISEKIIYVAIWNILLMACGLIFASVYGYVVRGTNGMEWEMDAIQRLHYIMGSKLNLILCTLLVMVILKKTKMKSAMPVMNAVVFVISILIGIILDIMLDYPYLDKKGKIAIGIAMVGILAINVFVYVATYQLNKSQKLLMENQLLRMSQEEQKEGMERMMRLQEKNRMLRHDLRHYFTLFQEMLANGNVEEAQKYVEDVLNTKLQPEGVYMTGDEILDAVLNHCDGICRQKQITFRTEISAHLPEGQMEFAIALLNLLENAIEAEELEEDKLIELQIYESAGLLLVTVRNRISQSVMENNPELRTRKADASLHGLGRKSVKKLIRDMEGSFYEEERNGFFISNIVV